MCKRRLSKINHGTGTMSFIYNSGTISFPIFEQNKVQMTSAAFREMALSFDGTEENPHFERAAFKVIKKRIFATLHEESATANLKLSPVDQSVFTSLGKKAVYPVPNKWGAQGWTTFELKKIPNSLMLDALNVAYQEVFKTKKL